MTAPERARGFTLAEALVLVLAAILLAAVFLPLRGRAARLEQVLACRDRLRTLHRAQEGLPPGTARGQAFWTRLAETSPPRIAPQALRCPLVEDPKAPECHYLGPAGDPAALEPQGPLGCDAPENHDPQGHRGGNILLKSGEVHTDDGILWRQALSRCSRQ
ncbi:MAG TPA: hypothetical protein VNO22_12155 [Planctomycetota bacterium]|nr:hypothetical protein [Planctomycetota bacterium]